MGGHVDALIELIHTWEWVLLLTVAVLEATILVHALRESRERQHLVNEMRDTRVELGRESYVAMKREALESAEDYVYFVSRTANADLLAAGERVFDSPHSATVRYRCLTGVDPGRLRDMFEQHRLGVEVRVNPMVTVSTFRFHVWDDRGAILAFSDDADEADVRGIRAVNPYFARVLKQHFEAMWDQSVPWHEWATSFLLQVSGTESSAPVKELADQWALTDADRQTLEALLQLPAVA